MAKRDKKEGAQAVPASRGGKKEKLLAALFYIAALVVYVLVGVWGFTLGDQVGWTYSVLTFYVILPLTAFFSAALMSYFKTAWFWTAPVVHGLASWLFVLITFRVYANWAFVLVMAGAALVGLGAARFYKLFRQRAKSAARRQEQKDQLQSNREKSADEALREFTDGEKK